MTFLSSFKPNSYLRQEISKNMKHLLTYFLFLSCVTSATAQSSAKENIDELLNTWHEAASKADFSEYFSKMADESIFIGTDPTENWDKQSFMSWSKPYFDKGKAWSFSTLERNIFLAEDCKLAWFDELLDTQMGICRGSGVVSKENGEWKVKHYVLSIEIPNENVDQVTRLKKDFDAELIKKLQ
jgi:hypothetical protein